MRRTRRTFAVTATLALSISALGVATALVACDGDDDTNPIGGADAASGDATTKGDASTTPDSTTPTDSSTPADSSTSTDGSTPADSGVHDSGTDAADAGDDACPSAWTTAPVVDTTIALPADGGSLVLHAGAVGSQNYECEATVLVDGGTSYAWIFVGPEATLSDCHMSKIGMHFASDAGAAAPEWQTTDGTYVFGHKLAAFTPDGGAAAIPWLLVQEASNGGSGTLSKVGYVQRLDTDAGIAPSTVCDDTTVTNVVKVPYTADYFFFGTP